MDQKPENDSTLPNSAVISLNITLFCRICASKNTTSALTIDNNTDLQVMMAECLCVKTDENDQQPQIVCIDCVNLLTQFYNFKQMYKKNEAMWIRLLAEQRIYTTTDEPSLEDALRINMKEEDQRPRFMKAHSPKLDVSKVTDSVKRKKKFSLSKKSNKLAKGSKNEIKRRELKTKVKTENDRFECEKCGKFFKNRQTLVQHVMRHGEPKFKCNQPNCTRKFFISHKLMVHLSMTHKVEQKVKCDTCPEKFFFEWQLEKHFQARHSTSKLKDYLCPICGLKVKCLKRHTALHQTEENLSLKCSTCSKIFINRRQLKIHSKMHEKNQSDRNENESIKCPSCDKTFTTRTGLYSHKYSVHTSKMQPCPICKIPLRIKVLKRHILFVHEKVKKEQCEICNGWFKDKYVLRLHTMMHTNERPFKCGMCGKGFRIRTHLRKHEKTHSELKNCKNENVSVTVIAEEQVKC